MLAARAIMVVRNLDVTPFDAIFKLRYSHSINTSQGLRQPPYQAGQDFSVDSSRSTRTVCNPSAVAEAAENYSREAETCRSPRREPPSAGDGPEDGDKVPGLFLGSRSLQVLTPASVPGL